MLCTALITAITAPLSHVNDAELLCALLELLRSVLRPTSSASAYDIPAQRLVRTDVLGVCVAIACNGAATYAESVHTRARIIAAQCLAAIGDVFTHEICTVSIEYTLCTKYMRIFVVTALFECLCVSKCICCGFTYVCTVLALSRAFAHTHIIVYCVCLSVDPRSNSYAH
jgi:hypothetical protein